MCCACPGFLQLRLGPLHVLAADHAPSPATSAGCGCRSNRTRRAGDQLSGHPRRLALRVADHRLLYGEIRFPFGFLCISTSAWRHRGVDVLQSSLQQPALGIKRCRIEQAGTCVELLTETAHEFDPAPLSP